jgi:hypothetical protein
LYLKAKQAGIIDTTPNGAIKYGPQVIGMSDEASILFLQDKHNIEVLRLLERAVNPEYFKVKEEDKKAKNTNEDTDVDIVGFRLDK